MFVKGQHTLRLCYALFKKKGLYSKCELTFSAKSIAVKQCNKNTLKKVAKLLASDNNKTRARAHTHTHTERERERTLPNQNHLYLPPKPSLPTHAITSQNNDQWLFYATVKKMSEARRGRGRD